MKHFWVVTLNSFQYHKKYQNLIIDKNEKL